MPIDLVSGFASVWQATSLGKIERGYVGLLHPATQHLQRLGDILVSAAMADVMPGEESVEAVLQDLERPEDGTSQTSKTGFVLFVYIL